MSAPDEAQGESVRRHTVAVLAELSQTCAQMADGFLGAARHVAAEDVRALLRRRAQDHQAQALLLQAHLRRLDPAAPLAVNCAPWSGQVGPALPGHSDGVLLEACEQAEDDLLERYAQAAAAVLEPAAREALFAQRIEMRAQHELLRTLRDRLRGLL